MNSYKKIKLSDGSTIDEHRLVWEKANGSIPPGFDIHHLNENKRDNRLENLEMLSRAEHHARHPEAEERRLQATRAKLTIVSPKGFAWCSSCGAHKEVENFHRKASRHNGCQEECKKCRKQKRFTRSRPVS